ncbi:alpha/beta hydrolase [Rhodocytophaga aerolata]|uniref:Alpha/beta hydrolase n=1 Tax=Rhodocytophaga aerolata TaxID=455078 RepID=A0ABT8RC70_9BACT|nr:alpha/beta hydrolase [Rhodocytophaga aerolata]MDO1449702.1 alpha/beta hydrolase [Rhodocytophaga aerolata]
MQTIQSKTILFVTGAFVSNNCWDEWKPYFESKGYTTYAPPWPYKDAPAAELRRRHPNGPLATLRLKQLVDHYAKFAKMLPEKPIIIGHSLGGLITQILINRDLGAAGAVLHPVPPQGVFPYEFSFLKAGWKALGLFTSTKKTYLMSLADWQYAFTNGMSLADQKASYEKITVPESKMVARDGLTNAAYVDFDKPHAPLLIIAGSADHIMPAHLSRRIFNRYNKQNGSVIEYKEYPGINHYVLGLPTWKTQANYILDWIAKLSIDQPLKEYIRYN